MTFQKTLSGCLMAFLLLLVGCGTPSNVNTASDNAPLTAASPAAPATSPTPAAAATTGDSENLNANSATAGSSAKSEGPATARRASSTGRAYYDYGQQPRKRSFWEKHRDKLTVAGTTAGGALIGGIIGGKKGAAIGALSGAGGGALYTYKIRKKKKNY
jgi:hypothetical protein